MQQYPIHSLVFYVYFANALSYCQACVTRIMVDAVISVILMIPELSAHVKMAVNLKPTSKHAVCISCCVSLCTCITSVVPYLARIPSSRPMIFFN